MPGKISLSLSMLGMQVAQPEIASARIVQNKSLPHISRRGVKAPNAANGWSDDLNLRSTFAAIFRPSKELDNVLIMNPALEYGKHIPQWDISPKLDSPRENVSGSLVLTIQPSTAVRQQKFKNIAKSAFQNEYSLLKEEILKEEALRRLPEVFSELSKRREKLEIVRPRQVVFQAATPETAQILLNSSDPGSALLQKYVADEKQKMTILFGSDLNLRYVALLKYQLHAQKCLTVHVREPQSVDAVARQVRATLLWCNTHE